MRKIGKAIKQMILYLPYVKAFTAFLEEKLNYTRRESTNIKSPKLRL